MAERQKKLILILLPEIHVETYQIEWMKCHPRILRNFPCQAHRPAVSFRVCSANDRTQPNWCRAIWWLSTIVRDCIDPVSVDNIWNRHVHWAHLPMQVLSSDDMFQPLNGHRFVHANYECLAMLQLPLDERCVSGHWSNERIYWFEWRRWRRVIKWLIFTFHILPIFVQLNRWHSIPTWPVVFSNKFRIPMDLHRPENMTSHWLTYSSLRRFPHETEWKEREWEWIGHKINRLNTNRN